MNKLAVYNVLSLTGYFVLAFFVGQFISPYLGSKPLFLGVFASWLILIIGIQIVHFKFNTGQFVGRFLIATVFQILGFLSLAVFLIYTQKDNKQALVLTIVVIHMVALAIQSAFFLRYGNKVS